MLTLFKSKRRSLIGIDISSTAIKILVLAERHGGYQVETFAIAPLPLHAVESNVIKDVDVVVKALQSLIEKHQLTSKQVAVAVPDSAIITKLIQLDANLTEMEMEEMVLLEADKYIPYSLDEINIDFDVLGTSAKNKELLDVLLVASRAENVSSRVDVISQAGLEPVIVDVESFAIERVCCLMREELPPQGKDKTVAIIDIGANYTHLYVLHNMKLVFTREEEFGCSQLHKEIAHHAKLDLPEAVNLLETNQLDSSYQEEVLSVFRENVVMQVKRTLQFFFSTSNHSYIDFIMLAGGGTHIAGLPDAIQQAINIPVSIVNPLQNLTVGTAVSKQEIITKGAQMMTCCGLALRDLHS